MKALVVDNLKSMSIFSFFFSSFCSSTSVRAPDLSLSASLNHFIMTSCVIFILDKKNRDRVRCTTVCKL